MCSSISRASDVPFDFEVLQYRAKTLATKPYAERPNRVPESLRKLNYDQYRDLRFNPDSAWWRRDRLPFQLQFFHPGFIYNRTVQLSEVNDGKTELIRYDKDLFNFGANRGIGSIPSDMGFTGFRVHYPLNSPEYYDELAVFQGASYFRALGQGMRYGLSARGLALNTAEQGGEEFPVFEEFWVERPGDKAKQIVIYALMDSPSVTGAFRFIITPGPSTVMEVKTAIYRRKDVAVFGVAPLTSMFWFGETTSNSYEDLRPEVHDSDGLLVQRGNGEWLWRPLSNPKSVRVASFSDENPKGFGLVQRDRKFESYQDLEAHYHERPSVWVEPVGAWGAGDVRLVELPTPDETQDNIVAFWVPKKLPSLEDPVKLEYKLHWFVEGKGGRTPPAGYAMATRIGRSATHEPELVRFWIDFTGPYLSNQPFGPTITPNISVGAGAKLVNQSIEKNPYNGSWRVAFAIKPDGKGTPVELRCFLQKPPHILTETWSYLWNP
ncbi:glucan biosynthesis protein G [Rariglobus hedericola]|uniref:Glucans biosynthesis protein G n=2 Tax=Rariglobus hedericola TaxID=2597822 RepID=A0A556QSU9_9BACT|nr:glucan biosynthesis protein G [Rariglobus hedericola]